MILLFALAAVRTVRCSFHGNVFCIAVAEYSGNVFAVLSGVVRIEDAVFGVAFAPPPGRPVPTAFLGAGSPIETGVFVISTGLHVNFALQARVSDWTGTEHAHGVGIFLFPGHDLILFDSRVRSKLSLAMLAFSIVVTMQITSPIVGSPC